MRVLMVVHGYPPRSQGGTETYTEALVQSLVAAQDTVRVLAREEDRALPERAVRLERREGYEVAYVNNTFSDSRSFADAWKGARLAEAVLPFIDAFAPEVAHVHHLTGLSTELVAALDARAVPVVFTLHDYWLQCQRGQLLDRDLEPCPGPTPQRCARCLGLSAGAPALLHRVAAGQRALWPRLPRRLSSALGRLERRAAAIPVNDGIGDAALERRLREVRALSERVEVFLCPSDSLRERFLSFGVEPDKLRRTRLGIDHRPFAGLRRTSAPELRLGFLGSLMASKAPHLLLEAFRALPPGRASVHLYGGIAAYHGDDSYRQVLAPLLAQPGVQHHGPVPHREVPRVLASLDVLVVPSVWPENAPLVIAEAALAGVPTVGSDLAGVRELVSHGESGLLFSPGDARSLAASLRRLLDEPELLPRLRRGLGEPKSIEADARQVREVYEGLVRVRRPTRRPRLVAVVLNYRGLSLTLDCLASLERSAQRPDALLVVDNDSGDGSGAFLTERLGPASVLRCEKNRGFSGGVNAGLAQALRQGADQVLVLNADIELGPETVGRLVAALEADSSLGVVGPVLVQRARPGLVESDGICWDPRSGRMRHPGFGAPYLRGLRSGARPVDGLSGACLLLSRRLLEAVGPLAPEYFFTFEDLDFCLRARAAGFGVACVDDAVALHIGGAALPAQAPRRTYFAVRNHLMLARRHGTGSGPEPLARAAGIVAFNAAHLLLRSGAPRAAGVAALLRGVLDYARGRSGSDD